MQIKRCGFSPIGWKRRQVLCGSEKKINSIGDLQMVLQFFILPKGDLQMKKKCLQVASQLNYSKLLMYCPSFRSTFVRRVTIPFIGFRSISCVMTDTSCRMVSFSLQTMSVAHGTLLTSRIPTAKNHRVSYQEILEAMIKVSTDNAILPKI